MTHHAVQHQAVPSTIEWDDCLPIMAGANAQGEYNEGSHSVFSDDVWDIYPTAGKVTVTRRTMTLSTAPQSFKDSLKRLVWCMLNIEAPIQMLERPTGARSRVTTGSAVAIFESSLRLFTTWLESNGFTRFCDISSNDLQRYGEEISGSILSRSMKAKRLFGLTRIWLLAPYLPEEDRLIQPPWESEGTHDLLGPANWSAENKTIPIHPQTMSPLLIWSLRFISEFSRDILEAISEKHELNKNLRNNIESGDHLKLQSYIATRFASGLGVPGLINTTGRTVIANRYIAAILGVGIYTFRGVSGKDLSIDIGCPLKTVPTATINGETWIEYFDYYRIEEYQQLLAAACIIVIAYLSGMRSEECRALARGSCRTIELEDDTARYEIHSLTFKEALDGDGNAIRGGIVREYPWHVIKPVHHAIKVMEQLHSSNLLFSEEALHVHPGKRRNLVLTSKKISRRIEWLITWCNSSCERLWMPHEKIPVDPDGRITMKRFRRTLAWFIYRQPGGRISLGIQYGHLRGMTTDGYGSRVSNGLRDVFPMEEAYAISDSMSEAAERLANGEGVSGPSSERYIIGVQEYAETYQGKYLTPRQASQLRRNPALRIYDNGEQPVACCYDVTKALCHPDRGVKKNVNSTPDLTRCNPHCANVARTDKHIEELKRDIEWQEEQMNSDLTPIPLKERHKQRIVNLEEIICRHEATKRTFAEVKV